MLFANTVPPSWGSSAITYKSDRDAHTDASNQGTISDNFLAKRVGSFDSLGDKSKKGGHWV